MKFPVHLTRSFTHQEGEGEKEKGESEKGNARVSGVEAARISLREIWSGILRGTLRRPFH